MADLYSRFYWRFMDEYPDVYSDKELLGWWLTLLVGADGAYPHPAHLPRSLPDEPLSKLVECGLVNLEPGDRYRVRGVEKEREQRSESGVFAADVRHHGLEEAQRRQAERKRAAIHTQSTSNATALRPQYDGTADPMPSKAKQ